MLFAHRSNVDMYQHRLRAEDLDSAFTDARINARPSSFAQPSAVGVDDGRENVPASRRGYVTVKTIA